MAGVSFAPWQVISNEGLKQVLNNTFDYSSNFLLSSDPAKVDGLIVLSVPRSQYQSVNGGKRITNRMSPQIMPTLPQHDDIIKFIFDSWCKVNREYSEQNFSEAGRNLTVTYYEEREPNPVLKEFEPFDLEAWWGKRLVQNIQAASSSSS